MRGIAIATAALCALLLPAAAQAHVTVQPDEAPAGGAFTVLDVRVPNETDNANTTKVDVQFPTRLRRGLLPGGSRLEGEGDPRRSWPSRCRPTTVPSPKASARSSGRAASRRRRSSRTSRSRSRSPAGPAKALTFKALQTYDNGEVVRWIGPPDAEEPAPQVQVTAAGEEGQQAATAAAGSSAGDEGSGSGDSASKGLGIAALILGALGLLAGGAALVSRRKAA